MLAEVLFLIVSQEDLKIKVALSTKDHGVVITGCDNGQHPV